MSRRHVARFPLAAAGIAAAIALATTLSGCAGSPDPETSSSTADAAATASATPTPTVTPVAIADFPIGASTSTTALPEELPQGCRDILTEDVLTELDGVTLNADGMGGGIRSDGARVCVWADPGTTATWLVTVIGYSPDEEARDALYELSTSEGYTCYEPDDGVRCEKTWDSTTVAGITEGRTLFYRDGVIIDTQYSNLAPAGYTDAIIAALWG
ncbi:MAG: hypothetical protein QM677_07965 [Microbacterium sp.]